MVALPCGSRSTSRTRRSDCESPAARLTLVVVLPTPPFWFATASTRATSGSGSAKHKVALGVEQRHAQPADVAAIAARRQLRELGGGQRAFDRRQHARGRDQVPAG